MAASVLSGIIRCISLCLKIFISAKRWEKRYSKEADLVNFNRLLISLASLIFDQERKVTFEHILISSFKILPPLPLKIWRKKSSNKWCHFFTYLQRHVHWDNFHGQHNIPRNIKKQEGLLLSNFWFAQIYINNCILYLTYPKICAVMWNISQSLLFLLCQLEKFYKTACFHS